ncbi:MAG TPA: hypothetical protein VIH16_11425 [Bellilinea sp.]
MNLEHEQNLRLIVLLPESLVGDLDFAQKVHWMASRAQKDVLYLTLLDDPDHGLSVARGIATMKAVTESNLVKAGSIQTPTQRWFEKLQQVLRPGDTIVCHTEQTVALGLFKTQPTADYLRLHLPNSVVTADGFYHPQRTILKSWMRGLLFWLGAIAIVTGFTLLELQADLAFPGFAHKLVLAVILIIEFGAVWFWSQIVRR